jgi:predicted nucleotidyltransferase component of viral defense system
MKMTNEELHAAVNHTAQTTGFSGRLIEKDYYCSLFLKHLADNAFLREHLVFKGGTLLAKGFLGFFRLSEDLDFAVSNEFCNSRSERRRVAEVLRDSVKQLISNIGIKEISPLRGFNESRQYNGIYGYTSVTGVTDTIKFEVGFRGDIMLPLVDTSLKTALVDPFSKRTALEPFVQKTLSREECFAEKARAALTRKTPAIRDLFDIGQIAKSGFSYSAEDFLDLVNRKISADSDATIDVTNSKKIFLNERVEQELIPVLRENHNFSFDDDWKILETIAHSASLQKKG